MSQPRHELLPHTGLKAARPSWVFEAGQGLQQATFTPTPKTSTTGTAVRRARLSRTSLAAAGLTPV
jgi:hypothetical protein